MVHTACFSTATESAVLGLFTETSVLHDWGIAKRTRGTSVKFVTGAHATGMLPPDHPVCYPDCDKPKAFWGWHSEYKHIQVKQPSLHAFPNKYLREHLCFRSRRKLLQQGPKNVQLKAQRFIQIRAWSKLSKSKHCHQMSLSKEVVP